MVSSGTWMRTARKAITLFVLALSVATIGAQAPVAPVPRQQFFDNSGIPVSGGKVCTYQAGTTTPLVTWTDSALSVQNTNPIILDTAGRPTNGSVEVGIYLSAASYKFVLMTAGSDATCATGVTLWTQDNVLATNYLTSAAGLATGSPSTTTFLRGDMTWAKPWTVVTSTSTGTLNDFAPGLVGNTVLRMNNATLATITGFAGGFDGQLLEVDEVGAGQTDFAYATSAAGLGSLAQDRLFNIATSGNTSLAGGSTGSALYRYDGTSTRWRLVSHDQGAWITPTFAAGSYTGASAMTWTVDSGDVQSLSYWLKGRTLSVQWNLITTTVGGTPSTILQIGNSAWGGFSPVTGSQFGAHDYQDNGGTHALGRVVATGSGNFIDLQKVDLSNWTASANLMGSFGSVQFQVQD